LISAILILICGCSKNDSKKEAPPNPEYITITLQSDPHADFAEAYKGGDLRMVAVHGYAIEVPGVKNYYSAYSGKVGLKVIEGTSDSSDDDAEFEFNYFAREYARHYNLLVVLALRAEQDSIIDVVGD